MKKKKKKISHRQLGLLHGSSSPFSHLSRRGLNPMKPVYDPDQQDGRLNLTSSAFNQLGQYTSSPDCRGLLLCRTCHFSSLSVAVAITSSHCTYPKRDGQAELTWVAGYVVRQFTCPKAMSYVAISYHMLSLLPLTNCCHTTTYIWTWSMLFQLLTSSSLE